MGSLYDKPRSDRPISETSKNKKGSADSRIRQNSGRSIRMIPKDLITSSEFLRRFVNRN